MKDPTILFHLEKSIIEKYGEETVKNPKINWNEEKEKEYLAQLKELSKKEYSVSSNEDDIVELNGVFIPKKLFIKENNKVCFACKCYSFKKDDDIYLNKYRTCFKCYVQFVEDREEKWLTKVLQENR